MRYIYDDLQDDLKSKMVLLSGPRQCGKTTLARALCGTDGLYLNWDIRTDQRMIRAQSWPKDLPLLVLDELHKFPKWKNYLKGIADEFSNRPPVLVTGSARLETFRRHGDALTGRTYAWRLHPIDLTEAPQFTPGLTSVEMMNRLLVTGGFPESYLNPDDAERLRNDRLDLVLREDLRDLSKSNALRQMELLVELLRARVGGLISYENLRADLDVSAPTVKTWIELLERLYLIFIVRPFTHKLSRSIKKEPKIFFYDCGAPLDSQLNGTGGALENVVASALLKFCHWRRDRMGNKFELHFIRDRDGREVDFCVSKNLKPHLLVECKSGKPEPSKSLRYYHEKLQPVHSIQIHRLDNRPQDFGGIKILEASQFLADLAAYI